LVNASDYQKELKMIESRLTLLFMILGAWLPCACNAQYIADAEIISVVAPYELQIVQDQAFDLEGVLYASGLYLGGYSVSINGTVDIGREVSAEFIDPVTGLPFVQMYFSSVRQVAVLGQGHVPGGIIWGGALVWFSQRVEANPHWIVGRTYICRAKSPAEPAGDGSFIVIAEIDDDADTKVTPVQYGN
jgi:hypothetical protein